QCPNCGEQVLLDNLEADEEALKKLKEFEEERKARKETKKASPEAGSPVNAKDPTPKPEDARSPSADQGQETKVDGTTSPHSTPNSKKRAASNELENNRKPANPGAANNAGKQSTPTPIPTGPKAQQQQQQQMPNMMKPANNMQDFAQQMNAMASSVPGMPGGMPGMANPMMNPMMMGMNPMMMGMPGFNPMMGMNGMGGGMNGM
ncbi:hypothetical protein KC352_g46369, partial [Hortaea werneckii]